MLLFFPADRVGELVAIKRHKQELEDQGWTEFWPSKEYRKLRPETAGLGSR